MAPFHSGWPARCLNGKPTNRTCVQEQLSSPLASSNGYSEAPPSPHGCRHLQLCNWKWARSWPALWRTKAALSEFSSTSSIVLSPAADSQVPLCQELESSVGKALGNPGSSLVSMLLHHSSCFSSNLPSPSPEAIQADCHPPLVV